MSLPSMVRQVASHGATNVIVWGDDEDSFAITFTGGHELILMQSSSVFVTQRMFPLHAPNFYPSLTRRACNAPRGRASSPSEG